MAAVLCWHLRVLLLGLLLLFAVPTQPATRSNEHNLPSSDCYELTQSDDICRTLEEREHELKAPSVADFSSAAAFLAIHEDQREKIPAELPGKLQVPCAGKTVQHGPASAAMAEEVGGRPRGVERTMLINLVPAYGGSTALQEFVLSNSRIASLCRGNMWQCEGQLLGTKKKHNWRNFTATARDLRLYDLMHNWSVLSDNGTVLNASFPEILSNTMAAARCFDVYNTAQSTTSKRACNWNDLAALNMSTAGRTVAFTEASLPSMIWDAVATWGRIWDLRKPVLLEKTPHLWFRGADVLHNALVHYRGPWPLRKIRPVYAMMWKPLCLQKLSSHFRKGFKKDPVKHLDYAVAAVERAVELVHWAKRVGARMIVLNYADLLWRPGIVSARLKALLPCVADFEFDAQWTPKLHADIYPGNRFKPAGTTFSYGKAHPPASQCYNLEASSCNFSDHCDSWKWHEAHFKNFTGASAKSTPKSPSLESFLKRYRLAAITLLAVQPGQLL